MGHGSPEIKQYDQFFLKWTWLFDRDFLKKIQTGSFNRTGRLIESLEYYVKRRGGIMLELLFHDRNIGRIQMKNVLEEKVKNLHVSRSQQSIIQSISTTMQIVLRRLLNNIGFIYHLRIVFVMIISQKSFGEPWNSGLFLL